MLTHIILFYLITNTFITYFCQVPVFATIGLLWSPLASSNPKAIGFPRAKELLHFLYLTSKDRYNEEEYSTPISVCHTFQQYFSDRPDTSSANISYAGLGVRENYQIHPFAPKRVPSAKGINPNKISCSVGYVKAAAPTLKYLAIGRYPRLRK